MKIKQIKAIIDAIKILEIYKKLLDYQNVQKGNHKFKALNDERAKEIEDIIEELSKFDVTGSDIKIKEVSDLFPKEQSFIATDISEPQSQLQI